MRRAHAAREATGASVGHGAVLKERFHHPIRKRDLRGSLRVVISMNRFQRATKEPVYVAGQELGAGCRVGRVNVHAPAIRTPRVDLRLQGGGDHVLVDAGSESARHEESRRCDGTGIIRGTPRSCAISETRARACPPGAQAGRDIRGSSTRRAGGANRRNCPAHGSRPQD